MFFEAERRISHITEHDLSELESGSSSAVPTPEIYSTLRSPASQKGTKRARKDTEDTQKTLLSMIMNKEDTDDAFCASLAAQMRHFTPQQKVLARLKLQEVIFKIENNILSYDNYQD